MACLAPMVLGMLSPSAYAMLTSQLMLLWHPAAGAVISWILSVGAITFPTLAVMRRRAPGNEKEAETKEDPETAERPQEQSDQPADSPAARRVLQL
ncbi:unnamed protein product [Symbiodinium sp. CCMP2592]|nr:unnamed protein product [Symbiodinium sp. CCMP2592]